MSIAYAKYSSLKIMWWVAAIQCSSARKFWGSSAIPFLSKCLHYKNLPMTVPSGVDEGRLRGRMVVKLSLSNTFSNYKGYCQLKLYEVFQLFYIIICEILYKILLKNTAYKVSVFGVFLVRIFSHSIPNAGKYGPENSKYGVEWDTFHTVEFLFQNMFNFSTVIVTSALLRKWRTINKFFTKGPTPFL